MAGVGMPDDALGQVEIWDVRFWSHALRRKGKEKVERTCMFRKRGNRQRGRDGRTNEANGEEKTDGRGKWTVGRTGKDGPTQLALSTIKN